MVSVQTKILSKIVLLNVLMSTPKPPTPGENEGAKHGCRQYDS